jgi:hypothetical protein
MKPTMRSSYAKSASTISEQLNPMTDDQNHADDMTTVRLRGQTHERLKAHCRDGETLTGVVARALDALEREQELPDAVADALGD